MGLSAFWYHSDLLDTGAFASSEESAVCDCCGKVTCIYYESFFSVQDIRYVCPEYILSGKAAQNYDGGFQGDCSLDDGVDDSEKMDKFIHCPGYFDWRYSKALEQLNGFPTEPSC